MTQPSDKQARAEAVLGELAELGLMLARELAVRARQAEGPAETERLATAFQKTSRSVRLCLALDAQLDRLAAKAAREEADAANRRDRELRELAETQARADRDAAPKPPTPLSDHRERASNLLNRLIWNESEGDEEEYEVLRDDLDARLFEASRYEGFLDIPVEVIAQRVASDMGLSGELVLTVPTPPKAPTAPATPAPTAAPPPQPVLADTG